MQKILDSVSDYIFDKENNKVWKEGDQINYSGPFFNEKEYVAGVRSLLDGWLGLGKAGSHFESMFPKQLGKKFGILTNSGSSANLLMYSALKSRRLYNLPEGTKILTPVALGNPPNMERVMYLIDKYKLILLEDCCDALGSTYNGKLLGSFGQMATCSFYPAHHITMGEGGFVATISTDEHTVLKSFRDWGRGCYCQGSAANNLKCGTCGKRFSNWMPEMPNEIFDHKYIYDEIGYNLKPIELQAAIGLEQLKKLSQIIRLRRMHFFGMYSMYFPYRKYFILPESTVYSIPSWFAFPLTIRPTAPFTREEIVNHMENNGIQTRPYFGGNILLQPGYADVAKKYSNNPLTDFPNATYATRNTFFHGVSPNLTAEQMEYIKKTLDKFMEKYS